MRKIVLGAFVALFIFACGTDSSNTDNAANDVTVEDIKDIWLNKEESHFAFEAHLAEEIPLDFIDFITSNKNLIRLPNDQPYLSILTLLFFARN